MPAPEFGSLWKHSTEHFFFGAARNDVDCVVALLEHIDEVAPAQPYVGQADFSADSQTYAHDAKECWVKTVIAAATYGSTDTLRWLLRRLKIAFPPTLSERTVCSIPVRFVVRR